jgi:hypothetical protein
MKLKKYFFVLATLMGIVCSTLSLKPFAPGFKLYVCDDTIDRCVLTDPRNNYVIDLMDPYIPDATVANSQPIGSCSLVCTGVNAAPEF